MKTRFTLAALLASICLYSPPASAQQAMSVADYPVTTGYVVRDYPSTGVPLLSWFNFWYVFGDNHLRQIFALPLGDEIHLSFLDNSGSDTIGYSVGHYAVTNIPWESYQGWCGGLGCVEWIGPHPPDTEFVLIGFSFWFTDNDHHLRQISIRETNGYLAVMYNDKSYDKPFGYTVEYSWVPRSKVLAKGNWGDGGKKTIKAQAGTVPDGAVVLQSFDVSYISLDHHVQRLAVSPREVSLYDHNHDDAIRTRVGWVKVTNSTKPPIEPPIEPPILQLR